MIRKVVMGLLVLGTIAGFGSGIARLVHGGGWHGRRHERFMDRVADECVEAARRADRRQSDGRRPGRRGGDWADFRADRPEPR